MSDVGKFLFELTRYEGVYFRGVVTAETDKTWTAQDGAHRPRRVLKAANIYAAPDSDAGERAKAAIAAIAGDQRALELQLVAVRKRAREAAVAALLSKPGE